MPAVSGGAVFPSRCGAPSPGSRDRRAGGAQGPGLACLPTPRHGAPRECGRSPPGTLALLPFAPLSPGGPLRPGRPGSPWKGLEKSASCSSDASSGAGPRRGWGHALPLPCLWSRSPCGHPRPPPWFAGPGPLCWASRPGATGREKAPGRLATPSALAGPPPWPGRLPWSLDLLAPQGCRLPPCNHPGPARRERVVLGLWPGAVLAFSLWGQGQLTRGRVTSTPSLDWLPGPRAWVGRLDKPLVQEPFRTLEAATLHLNREPLRPFVML